MNWIGDYYEALSKSIYNNIKSGLTAEDIRRSNEINHENYSIKLAKASAIVDNMKYNSSGAIHPNSGYDIEILRASDVGSASIGLGRDQFVIKSKIVGGYDFGDGKKVPAYSTISTYCQYLYRVNNFELCRLGPIPIP